MNRQFSFQEVYTANSYFLPSTEEFLPSMSERIDSESPSARSNRWGRKQGMLQLHRQHGKLALHAAYTYTALH